MTAQRPMLFTPLSLVLLTSALAGFAAWREPDGLIAFIIALLFLPVAWMIVEWRQKGRERDEGWLDDMRTIRWSVSAAALMMIIPLGFTLAISYELTAMLSDDLEKRVMGVMFGLIFLFYGNLSTKRPVSLFTSKASPERLQAHARFAGRIFVFAGLVYTLIWSFAPIAWANAAALSVLAGSVLIVMLNYVRLGRQG